MNKYYGLINCVSFSNFCDSFSDIYKNNFTYEGKKALFDYLEQSADDMGENIELDTVALCCEYSEYESAIECAKNYFTFALSDIDTITADEAEAEALQFLQDNTQVIELENGSIIINNF